MKNLILKLSIIISVFCSCDDNTQEIVLYKNLGEIDRAYDITEGTFWDFKVVGDIDSLKVDNTVDFQNVYSRLIKKSFKEKPFLNPEYAIVIKTSRTIDTIYLNEELDKGYSIKNSVIFEDTKEKILSEYFKEIQF